MILITVCKQNHPVQVTHLHEEYEVEMLQSVRTIPTRVVEINQTVWTQLHDNEWLYVAPRPEVLTVLCSKREPSDIEIVGIGKLKLHSACKGYGSRILIQAQCMYIVDDRHFQTFWQHCLPRASVSVPSEQHIPFYHVFAHRYVVFRLFSNFL